MKKIAAYILSFALLIGLVPCNIVQAAEVIFRSNMEYSVAIDGKTLELSPKSESFPDDPYHIVRIPENTEYITIVKGEAGYPNIIYKSNGITDGEAEYEIFTLPIWTEASYNSAERSYTIPVKDIKSKAYLTLLNASGDVSKLYLYKEAVVIPPEENVKNAISALPSPETLTLDDKTAVEAARTAYDALDDAAKANVTNYQTLVIAELTIEKLQLQADKTELQSNLDKAEEALEQSKANEEKLQSDLDQAEEALEQSKANEEKLQSDLDQVKEDLDSANGEKDGLQEQLNEKKEELATTQQETTALTEQVDTLKKDIKEKDDELKSVKEELATAKVTPEKVVITSVVNKKAKKAVVKWAKAPKATGYEVYRKVGKSGSYKKVKTISKASTVSFTNSKLKKGKTYYYKVRAVNKTNGKTTYGAFSAVKKVKIKK